MIRISISHLIAGGLFSGQSKAATVVFADGSTATAALVAEGLVTIRYKHSATTFKIAEKHQRRGMRRYFVCRTTGQRVNHLYWTGERFASRMEAGLLYESAIGAAPKIPRKTA